MYEGRCFVTNLFFALLQITNVIICHKVTHEYSESIERRRWLIVLDVLETDKAADYGALYGGGADLYG